MNWLGGFGGGIWVVLVFGFFAGGVANYKNKFRVNWQCNLTVPVNIGVVQFAGNLITNLYESTR